MEASVPHPRSPLAPARPLRRRRVLAALLLAGGAAVALDAAQNRPSRPLVPPDAQTAIEAVIAAYDAGDDLAVERWLRTPDGMSAIRYVQPVLVGPEWTRARAAFLLEVASATAASNPARALAAIRSGIALAQLRPAAGRTTDEDRFEMLWHRAALGIEQGMLQYGSQATHLEQILPRLRPDDARGAGGSRIPLARAIAAAGGCCQAGSYLRDGRRVVIAPSPAAPTFVRALELFARAAEVSDLRVEALVRGGVLLASANQPAEALDWLDRAGDGHTDQVIGYVQQITRGRMLDALNRPADAATAYEAARRFAPAAQLAAIGLASALLRAGQPDDAAVVASAARRLPEESVDLRQVFARADARFVREWLGEIRRLRR